MNKVIASVFAMILLAVNALGCGEFIAVVGTWRSMGQTITYQGTSVMVDSTLTFTGATPGETMRGTFNEDSTLTAASTGCVFRFNAQGTWTDTVRDYTAMYTAGMITQTGCMDATQNFDQRAMTPAEVSAVNARLGGTATLTAMRLGFKQFGQELNYTRQP